MLYVLFYVEQIKSCHSICNFLYAVMWTILPQNSPSKESIQWELTSEGIILSLFSLSLSNFLFIKLTDGYDENWFLFFLLLQHSFFFYFLFIFYSLSSSSFSIYLFSFNAWTTTKLELGQTIEISASSWLDPGCTQPHMEIWFSNLILTWPKAHSQWLTHAQTDKHMLGCRYTYTGCGHGYTAILEN